MLKLLSKLRSRLAATMLAALAASQALGAVSVTQKFWRNGNTIAVEAVVNGEADTTQTVQIWQRVNGAAFDSGMVMTRRPQNSGTRAGLLGSHTYGGRILWIPVNDTCDFYTESRGAGGTARSAVDSASVPRIPKFAPNTTNYWANADPTIGNDGNDGLSESFQGGGIGPKRTIQAAVNLIQTNNATDGTRVHVANGEYHEAVVLSGGTNGRHYQLVGESRDSTIICGANPNVEKGTYDGTNAIVWTADGPDSVWRTYFPSLGGPADSTQLIVLGFGEQLHRKTSRQALNVDSVKVLSGCFSSSAQPEASGWVYHNDTLYVKRATKPTTMWSSGANNTSPTVSGNHFGYIDHPLWIKARNWTVSTLTVRYAGSSRNDNGATGTAYLLANDGATCAALNNCVEGVQNPSLNGHCITLGDGTISTSRPAGAVLYNLRVYGGNAGLIYGPQYANAVNTDSMTVANCIIDGLTVGTMSYSAGKCRSEESINAVELDGKVNTVYNNTIQGVYNGIVANSGITVDADSINGSFSEYSYNRIQRVVDDAIEIDNAGCINALSFFNDIRAVGSGFSAVPGKLGPIMAIKNTFAYRARGAKIGGGNQAPTLWYHNTFYPDPTLGVTGVSNFAVDAVGGAVTYQKFRNNNFVGSPAATATISINGPATADTAATYFRTSTQSSTEFGFNYNNFYCGSLATNNIATWAGNPANRTLITWRSTFLWDTDGLASASVTQSFVSAAGYNFHIKSTATNEIDHGMRLTGVNAAFGLRLTAGVANRADIGAFEFFPLPTGLRWWRRLFYHT